MLHYEGLDQPRAAERLWQAAEYSQCLEQLATEPPSAARSLLRAKALYRMRRYGEALMSLDEGAPFFTGETRARADALAALLHAASGDFEPSNARLRAVEATDRSRFSREARLEIEHGRAICAWLRNDLIEAEAIVARCDRSGDPNADALGKFIRSWVRASRGKLLEQAALLSEALELYERTTNPDVGMMARTAFALAACTREFHLPNELAAVTAAIKQIPWTADLRLEWFQTLRLSGWANALQANYITAIRHLQSARDVAPTAYYEVFSRFDRAGVSRIAGEPSSCSAETLNAAEIALSLDWSKPNGEECLALLVGAEIAAREDLRAARTMLERFRDVRKNVSASMAASRDPRITALLYVAEAAIAEASNDVNGVRRHAKAAFDIYDGLGIQWRAALCALQLYRAGCGEQWLTVARSNAADYSRSFIALEIARYDSARGTVRCSDLTARQREVFALLMDGLSIDDIADKLVCSRNTIRIHVGAIYRKFGVNNRVELITRAG